MSPMTSLAHYQVNDKSLSCINVGAEVKLVAHKPTYLGHCANGYFVASFFISSRSTVPAVNGTPAAAKASLMDSPLPLIGKGKLN